MDFDLQHPILVKYRARGGKAVVPNSVIPVRDHSLQRQIYESLIARCLQTELASEWREGQIVWTAVHRA